MEKILIIANPTSGSRESENIVGKLVDIFNRKGYSYKLYLTTGTDNFNQLTQRAVAEGFDTVAILGGDGTISQYVGQTSALDQRLTILLIPLGTTNNLARALRTELNMEELLDRIEQDQLVEKQIDVGKMNDTHFISTVSAGSIPEVAWKADDELKEALGPFGYVLEGLSVLNDDQIFDLNIQTETVEMTIKDVSLMIIGLSNSVFGISTFFEQGELDDGKLYLFVLKSSNLIQETSAMVRHIFPNKQNKKAVNDELTFTKSFKKAIVHSSEDLHLAIDGEKGPKFPLKLDVLQKHVTFLVPEIKNKKRL